MKINKNTDLSAELPTARATPDLPQVRGCQEISVGRKGLTLKNEAGDDGPTTRAIATTMLLLGPIAGAAICMYIASMLITSAAGIGVAGLLALVVLLVVAVFLFRGMRDPRQSSG